MLYRIGNIRQVQPCLGEAMGTSPHPPPSRNRYATSVSMHMHEAMSGVEDRLAGSCRQPAYPPYGDVDRKQQGVGIGHHVDERRLRGRQRTRESTAKPPALLPA